MAKIVTPKSIDEAFSVPDWRNAKLFVKWSRKGAKWPKVNDWASMKRNTEYENQLTAMRVKAYLQHFMEIPLHLNFAGNGRDPLAFGDTFIKPEHMPTYGRFLKGLYTRNPNIYKIPLGYGEVDGSLGTMCRVVIPKWKMALECIEPAAHQFFPYEVRDLQDNHVLDCFLWHSNNHVVDCEDFAASGYKPIIRTNGTPGWHIKTKDLSERMWRGDYVVRRSIIGDRKIFYNRAREMRQYFSLEAAEKLAPILPETSIFCPVQINEKG